MLLPRAKRFAALVALDDPVDPFASLRSAAADTGLEIEVFDIRSDHDIDTAFASLRPRHIEGLVIAPNLLLLNRRVQVLTLAARHALAAIYPAREWAVAGGLMSYGSSLRDQFLQAGIYTGRVLKGEKPADLPIARATKFEFVINVQTAKALAFDIPSTLLSVADEVIE